MGRPLATYRLQLRPGFGFAAARELVGYLDALGVSDVYLSPVFEARAGSDHGYDVTDPNRIREELGGRAGFDALVADVRRAGMGLLLDIVPNHLAATTANPWWRDVLLHGTESPAAEIFDIDWEGSDACPPGKVLLPILGRELDDAIARGVVRIERHGEGFGLRVAGERLPLRGAVEAEDDVAAVLERQAYVLARWRPGLAPNYRRFFDIDELVGVRVEDPAVFERTHALVLDLVRTSAIAGLRIDHVDGLTDPRAYLQRLRAAIGPDVYMVVEKILCGDEELRSAWPVDGTTGYEGMRDLDALFVDPAGLRALDDSAPFAVIERTAKRDVLDLLFAAELDALQGRFGVRKGSHTPISDAKTALAALTVACPVYRTYADADGASDEDRRVIDEAVEEAGRAGADREALARVRDVLLDTTDLAQRWQQLTAPVMAKGREDTACYRHSRLVSLNEVGGDPDGPPEGAVARFHERNRARVARGLHGLTATSTHDTKRSEDVRARISVLSEVPEAWREALARWRDRNGDAVAPGDQRLLAQTLLGVWPANRSTDLDGLRDRVRAYMVKAAREAKLRTSWLEPDEGYESALRSLIDAQFASGGERFLDALGELAPVVAFFGAVNSLASVVLKVAMPGVPDFYQGCELWDLSLVDPDNRRPIDFALRHTLLDEIRHTNDPGALLDDWPDGRIKLWVTHRSLVLRRRLAHVFEEGAYHPLTASGRRAENVVAFARRAGGDWAVAIAPRLCTGLVTAGGFPVGAVWRDTRAELPAGAPASWADALTGSRIESHERALDLATCLATLPVALLVRVAGD